MDEDKAFCLPLIEKFLGVNLDFFGKYYNLNKITNSPFKAFLIPLKERFPEASKFRILFSGGQLVFEFWKEVKLFKYGVQTRAELLKEIRYDFKLS